MHGKILKTLSLILAISIFFGILPPTALAMRSELESNDPFTAMYDSGLYIEEKLEVEVEIETRRMSSASAVLTETARTRTADETREKLEEIYEHDRYIIKYKETRGTSLSRHNVLRGSRSESLSVSDGGRVELLILPEKTNPKSIADALRASGAGAEIEYIQPDVPVWLESVDDELGIVYCVEKT